MQDILAKIDELRTRSLAELDRISSPIDLEKWRNRYIGINGEIRSATTFVMLAPIQDKGAVGQRVVEIRGEVGSAFEKKKVQLN